MIPLQATKDDDGQLYLSGGLLHVDQDSNPN
jgi:hypothetical protein